MIATLEIAGVTRHADLSAGTSLAIPVRDGGGHPRFFVDEPVSFRPLCAGSFSGRVQAGGSCNADQISFVPHCHGTHTEGVGHITADRQAVQDHMPEGMLTAALVSVRTEPAAKTAGNPVVAASELNWPSGTEALIVRTLPNHPDKCVRDYSRAPLYPLLTLEAMTRIRDGGIRHLLVDTPSVDAADNDRLPLHRCFWGMDENGSRVPQSRLGCTISEMIYVPDSLADGQYLLHLGIGALIGDASPSSPVVFPLT